MNIWKIILATVVIFATGVITGGLIVGVSHRINGGGPVFRPWRPPVVEVVNPGNPGIQPLFDKKRLDFVLSVHRELNLSREQRERIEKIVRDGQERTRAIMENVSPELRKETREVREKIREVLTPDQKKRFEQLLKQRGPEQQRQMPPRGQRDPRFPNPPRNPPQPDSEPMSPPPENPPPGEPSSPPAGNAY